MIYQIIEVLTTLIDAVFLVWYVPNFLHTKFYKKENRVALIIPVVLLLFQIIADRILSGFDILAVIITSGLSIMYAILISKKKIVRAFIAGGSFMLVIMLVSSITYPLLVLLFGEGTQVMQGDQSPQRILYLAICRIIQLALYKLLLIIFSSDDNADAKSGIFFLGHMLITIFGLFVLMMIAVSDTARQFTVPIMVLLIIFILSNFGVFFLIRQIMKMQRREYEYKIIEEKMRIEKSRAEDAEAIWDNIQRFRHDMKNHFSIIKCKLNEGDIKSCEKYIDEIYPVVEKVGNLTHTGNSIIDYLINTKLSDDKGIQIIVSGYTEIFNDIESADLVSLLGNILDNALEAVEKISNPKDKRIELHFLQSNKNRIILCKNSIESSVLKNNKDLKTTKKGGAHGYGNKIVSSISEKYGGFAEYLESDGMFCVQILMPGK
ncbi:MAG: GHKL domain-containing protein [Alphaproteobacteria bacterium]|nr:GHKL domain-containing protein [Alphaproteobacteria bacterium]